MARGRTGAGPIVQNRTIGRLRDPTGRVLAECNPGRHRGFHVGGMGDDEAAEGLGRGSDRAREEEKRQMGGGMSGKGGARSTRGVAAGLAAIAAVVLGVGAGNAGAGTSSLFGPNTDLPDSNLVMPFAAAGGRTTFLSLSNVGSGAISARWSFYDASGELLVEVDRSVLGEGGTDLVDVTAIASVPPGEAPPADLQGHDGFVVIAGDGDPRLVGSFTIANVATSSAFGAAATGLGAVGILAPNTILLGTTFNPSTLDDDLLILLAIDDLGPVPTSLTGGAPPPPGGLFHLDVTLHGNEGDGVIAHVTQQIGASALFVSLEDLFPTANLDSSATIAAFSDTEGVALIGYYGQSLGPFGAGQNLRQE